MPGHVLEADEHVSGAPQRRWRSEREGLARLWFPTVVYVVSRVAVLVASYYAAFMKMVDTPRLHALRAYTAGPGKLYLALADVGYPSRLSSHGTDPFSAAPVFPYVLRETNRISPLPPRETAIAVATLFGFAATLVVWEIARELFDRPTADRAALLFCFLPGAYALSFAVPLALTVVLAAVCLLALTKRWWILAGAAGALATATQTAALVLVVCAAWAAVEAIRARREYRALAAPILTACGWLVVVLFVAARTGHPDGWFAAQHGGWRESFDAGWHTLSEAANFVAFSRGSVPDLFFGLTVAVLVFGAWCMTRVRLPAIYVVYTIGIVLPALTTASDRVTAAVLVLAFPIVLSAARWMREEAYWAVAASFGATMALASLWITWKPGGLV
jgi:hypothetical protein